MGDTISVAQTAYATSAGNYFYVMTDSDDCTQVSEFVEIREYSTPFLGADPGTVLCPGGSLTLHVDADPGVLINWGPPFSGSNNQQTVTDTGTYTVSVTFCDITTTLNIVITSPTVEAEISVIGDSLLCSGQTVTLMANAGPYGYDWQPVGESTPDLLVEDEGTYILTVTDENGCTATDSISFSMITSPPPPTSVTGDTVCVGDSAVVYAQGPGTIAWYLSNNSPYLALGNEYTTPPITGQDVLYAGIVDTVTGCHSLLITVDLAVKPAPVAPPVIVDTTICLGNTLTLGFDSLQSNMAYTWQGPGIVPIAQNPIVVNNFANGNEGTYYLVVTPVDSTLCGVDTASFNISTVDLPQINLPGDTLLACIGSDILLQTDTAQGVTYTWQWPGGSGTGASVEVINFQPNDEGYYIVTSTNTLEGCSSVDSVFADGIPLPVVQLSTAQLLCVGDSVTITASSLGLPTGSTYTWSGPANFVQGDSSITIVNATTAASGQYTLEITAMGCSPTPQSIDIVVNYIDTLAVVTDTVFCAGGALQLQVPAIYATYSWNTGATTPKLQ
ncbi:MAG: hypothetical protein M0D57_04825 [Sphingobacteriales bacterium JAD_PAG50586_3]|nr:MAG: hypothetical protein M0D57_04825 [Sphingobacteriales bacterium JAD_PAG50586_3]